MSNDWKSLIGWEEIALPPAPDAPVPMADPERAIIPNPELEPEQPEGPGMLDRFAGGFTTGRELDGSVSAGRRWHKESQFKRDPDYNLDDLDELMKDVPTPYRALAKKRLMESRSADHSRYIIDQMNSEIANEKKMATFGTAGFLGRLGANILDEGAIGLGLLTGGVGWLARGYKASRWMRAGIYGSAGAAENALLEYGVTSTSKTRTGDDIMYAALFGGLLGGAAGAVFGGAAEGAARAGRTGRVADDLDTHLARDRTPTPDVAGARGIDALDAAAHADLTGKPLAKDLPDNVRNFVNEIDEEVSSTVVNSAKRQLDAGEAERLHVGSLKSRISKLEAVARAGTAHAAVKAAMDDVLKAAEEVKGLAKGVDSTEALQRVKDAEGGFMQTLKAISPEEYQALRVKLRKAPDDPQKRAALLSNKTSTLLAKLEKSGEKVEVSADELAKLKDQLAKMTASRDAAVAAATEEPKARSAGAAHVYAAEDDLADSIPIEAMEYYLDTYDTAFQSGRHGGFAMINRSENTVAKKMGHVLLPDHVGAKKGERIATPISATSKAEMFRQVTFAKYQLAKQQAYDEWCIANGKRLQRLMPETQAEFNKAVTDAKEFGTNDPHLLKAAQAADDALETTHAFAQRAGVKGFDRFDHAEDYVPHIPDHSAWTKAANTYVNPNGDTPPLQDLVGKAYLRQIPEADPKAVRRLAKKYVTKIREKDMGLGSLYRDMARMMDPVYAREAFREFGMDEGDITSLLEAMSNANKATKAGATPRAKVRTPLDMETSGMYKNKQTGEMEEVFLRDLYVRDIDRLVIPYVHSVSGWAAIADVTKGTPRHITGQSAWEGIKREARLLENSGIERKRKLSDFFTRFSVNEGGDVLNNELALLDMAIKKIVGRPVNDPDSLWSNATRKLHSWNFTTNLGQVAFAQGGEFGAMTQGISMKSMLKTMPELRSAFKRGADGKLEHETARFIEEQLGLGTSALRDKANPVWMQNPDDFGQAMDDVVDRVLHVGKRVTAWPMMKMMTGQQRSYALALQQTVTDLALGRAEMTAAKMSRLRAHGISDDMWKRIQAQAQQYYEDVPMQTSAKTRVEMDWTKWDDQDARDALTGAMFAMARRAIQENDLGNINPLLSRRIGGLLFEFRQFQLGAWEKHLLYNLNQRDFESFVAFTSMSAMASLFYVAQQHVRAIGMDERQKKKFLDKRLAAEEVWKAGFSRAAYSSILPSMADTILWAGGYEELFNQRASGLHQNLLTGNPTVAKVDALGRGLLRGPLGAMFNPEYKYSWEDYRALQHSLLWSNLIGIDNVWKAIGRSLDLPYKSLPEEYGQ